MQMGIVGLGRMGAGISRRLVRAGHHVVGFDRDPATARPLADAGVGVVGSIGELVDTLKGPRIVWMMVPSGPSVDDTIAALLERLSPPATLIDGGNSDYRDTLERHARMAGSGVELVDVGTSGGIRGETQGYCLMAGGTREAVDPLRPLLESLAPGPDRGWGHVGPPGSGHFVKMVHNGIEYGMMQALAEGFALLERRREFDLDLPTIAGIWNEGSVIRSWLLELAGIALRDNPTLEGIRSEVDDSGEGRWTVREAIDLDVALPVITHALMSRIASREPEAFSNRMLSALRHQFGGHSADSGRS